MNVQPAVHNKQMSFITCNREKHSTLHAVLEEWFDLMKQAYFYCICFPRYFYHLSFLNI